MPYLDYEKITQILNLIACKNNGSIGKLRAMKMIWAADRYHLRKYGRSVTGDQYFAVRNGPMASCASNIAGQSLRTKNAGIVLGYAKTYISLEGTKERPLVVSKKNPEMDFFSKTDVEAIEFAYRFFSKMPISDVVEFGHNFPEWKKFKAQINKNPHTRFEIDILDFFRDSSSAEDPFRMSDKHLETSKEIFTNS